MSYISVYRIELDKDIMVLLSGREIRSDADMPYSRWYEEQLSRCKYVGMDERDCSPANLKNVITQGKDIFIRDRNEINGRWIEMELTGSPDERAVILVVKDIHDNIVMERKRRRMEVYHFYRNRVKQMRDKGFYCGLLVLDMDRGGEVCFAEKNIRQYLTDNENSETLTRLRKYITRPSFEVKTENDWNDGGECQNVNLGNRGEERWIQLYGSMITTESGRHFKYLMYMGMRTGINNILNGEEKGDTQLVERSEGYMFEWNIRDNILILGDNWDSKFRINTQGIHDKGLKQMEEYIWRDDCPRLRRFFDSALYGEKQDNMLIRFRTYQSGNSYAWCSLNLLSVLCDKEMPVYVVGIVKDISQKLKYLSEKALEDYGGSVGNKVVAARDYVDGILCEKKPESVHALLLIGMEKIIPEEDPVGLDILTYQFIEILTKMMYPRDRVWIEDGKLLLFLNQIGSRENARNKSNRIAKVIERMTGYNMATDIGMALYPEDGGTYELLFKVVRNELWSGTRVDRGMNEMEEQSLSGDDGHSLSVVADIVDEWYRMIRVNNLLEKKMRMTQAQLMLSQIKPHFIYNVLANIKSLIHNDPNRAETVLVAFTRFLRVQLDAIGKDEMALFSENLSFVSNYLEIEASRFPGKFETCYDIQYQDFYMPHFILQPLVENAIKHGICKRSDTGHITIRSRLERDEIIVEVEDDGVGFDMSYSPENKIVCGGDRWGSGGVGLENVRARISYLTHGCLRITSVPGKGTVASVIMPKTVEAKGVKSEK